MDNPRNFIAASIGRNERGPKRRINRATIRARTVGMNIRSDFCPDATAHLAACCSAGRGKLQE